MRPGITCSGTQIKVVQQKKKEGRPKDTCLFGRPFFLTFFYMMVICLMRESQCMQEGPKRKSTLEHLECLEGVSKLEEISLLVVLAQRFFTEEGLAP